MKKIAILTLILLVTGRISSQNIAGCNNAQNICSNPNFLFQGISGTGLPSTLTVSNPNTNPQVGNGSNSAAPANSGCLLTNGPGPQWLVLTVSVSGNLGFIFGNPGSPNPQVGFYDWAMWPYNSSTCNNIFNNTLPPVSCNWNASSSGGTGMGPVPSGGVVGNYQPSLPVTAGQQFLILISNYSGVNSLVSFTSTGTASLTCGFNSAICAGNSVTVSPVGFVPLTNQTFTLQPPGLTNSTGSFVVSPLVTTIYTVQGSGLNTQSVQVVQTSTTNVTVNPQPSVAPTVTNNTCTNPTNSFNLGLSFFPLNTNPSYTVVWTPTLGGITSPTQTALTGTISAGQYTAIVTSVGGCSATAIFSINPQPAPAIISLTPLNLSHTITCAQPTVIITSLAAASNYTWTNGIIAPITGSVAALTGTAVGTWTIIAVNATSGCTATKTFVVTQNITAPTSVMSPTFQNITCTLSSITTVTASATPTVNVTHQIYSPQGGTFTANSHTISYIPGGVGIFTYCVVDDINGCSTCKTFTVASNQGFPTYSVVSAENFTLGCGSRSIAVINIINGNTTPPGGSISYTILPPGSSTSTPSGTLSSISTYTVSNAGTYTMVTKDNLSLCETRNPISILSNTFAPHDSAYVPLQILDCNIQRVTLKGASKTSNINYVWSFPGTPGTQPGDTITVFANFAAFNSSVVADFTLTITDNSSTCKSTTVVPIRQNLYPPKGFISNGGTSSLTCNTATIMLTNLSTTGIPQTTGFPDNQQVIGFLWDGPSPQEQGYSSSTYLAATVGVYTLTAKDLNNGCTSQTTTVIGDNRIYPVITNKNPKPTFTLDCGNDFVKIGPVFGSSPNPFGYSWTYPPGASVTPAANGSITTNMIGNYREVVTNTLNGCSTMGEFVVINGSLTAAFEVQPSQGFAPLNVTFFNNSASSSTVSGQASASITAYWNFANGTNSTTTSSNLSPASTYSLPGTYTIQMFVAKGSCLDTAEKTIYVEIPSELVIPNVFTPNGDNVNDIFFLKSTNLQEITILIYDRWGHKVYDLVSDKGNIAWDGKNQAGKEVADGTYFYIIKATGKDGQSYDKKGTVSLYR